jgi:hypothetical protein
VRGTAPDLTFNVGRTKSRGTSGSSPRPTRSSRPASTTTPSGPAQTGRAPGLSVSGAGRSCTDLWGSFALHQIETYADGGIRALEATFEQRCESASAPLLTGTVRYHVRPQSFGYTSDTGDHLGRGTANTYLGAATTFTVDGSADGIGFRASGPRDQWRVSLAPPTGQQLAERFYPDANRLPDASHPGLDVSVTGRPCNEIAGDFTITRLVIDATGKPVSFTAHSEAGKPAARGTIHYYA